MKKYLPIAFVASCLIGVLTGCATNDVFEKDVKIKDQQWNAADRQSVQFDIEDTTALYNVFITLRHTDAYKYNNIWMNVYTKAPGDAKATRQQLDLTLGNNDKGWLGSGMDDIFYHRIRITRDPVHFNKKGTYDFALEQIMRDDPLEHVMNVGLRVEKAN